MKVKTQGECANHLFHMVMRYPDFLKCICFHVSATRNAQNVNKMNIIIVILAQLFGCRNHFTNILFTSGGVYYIFSSISSYSVHNCSKVSCCGFRRWHVLHMFVELFQGQYKLVWNQWGTCDFRMVSALFLILRILITHNEY